MPDCPSNEKINLNGAPNEPACYEHPTFLTDRLLASAFAVKARMQDGLCGYAIHKSVRDAQCGLGPKNIEFGTKIEFWGITEIERG